MAGSDPGCNEKADPRVRNLRKRLAQVAAIEQKQESGVDLTDEQVDKLSRKAQLEAELQELLDPTPEISQVEAPAEPSVEETAVVQLELVQTEDAAADLPETEGSKKNGDAEMLAESETSERPPEQSHEETTQERPDEKTSKDSLKVEETLQPPSKAEVAPESKSDSRLRNLRKKLAQIDALEKKRDADNVELTPEQMEKLSHKAEFEAELNKLLQPEAVEVGAQAVEVETETTPPTTPKLSTKSNSSKKPLMACPWCKRKVLPFPCPWSSWDCSTCSRDYLQSELIYSCPNQAECQSINEWGVCLKCAEDVQPNKSKGKDFGLLDLDENSIETSAYGLRSPSLSVLRSPSMRWQDDPVSVEDMTPSKPWKAPPEFEFLENIQPFSQTVQSSERLKALTKEVSLLSAAAFEEDALTYVTRKGGWRMTIIARPEGVQDCSELPLDGFCLDGPSPSLIGFIVYRLRPELDSLSIAKIAIVPEHRQRGHGRRLIDWSIKLAKKQPDITFISLSSLPEAVKFYLAIGFKAIDVKLENAVSAQCGPDEDLVEGQVYMEYRIKGRSRARKKGK